MAASDMLHGEARFDDTPRISYFVPDGITEAIRIYIHSRLSRLESLGFGQGLGMGSVGVWIWMIWERHRMEVFWSMRYPSV